MKNKIRYFTLGFILIIIGIIWFFNISLTSLPTTFPNMIKDHISVEEDFDKIEEIKISKSWSITSGFTVKPPVDEREFVIKDNEEIYSLINTGPRVS